MFYITLQTLSTLLLEFDILRKNLIKGKEIRFSIRDIIKPLVVIMKSFMNPITLPFFFGLILRIILDYYKIQFVKNLIT
jgi:hypothetical protein